ncbi:cardiolipin synthase [Gemmata sp.]|uniref:cardiolipin synthase n=1 Tax=Gemmata sp. TaxID=1914242 RepID=UPI003F7050D5
MGFMDFVTRFAPDIAGSLVVLDVLVVGGTLVWVLQTKRETMSAIAWSLTVLLVPFLGALLFFLFGSQYIERPLRRKQSKRSAYQRLDHGGEGHAATGAPGAGVPERWDTLARLGHHGDGFPVTGGNAVALYHDGHPAYDAMLAAIKAAERHVHLQTFIFANDATGHRFMDALCDCARRKVEVRFLYDSIGSYNISSRLLRQLADAGGRAAAFLPMLGPMHRLRVNLRNHRKILVVDGRVAFAGGLNVGDEYLGRDPALGPWRDTHLRLEGPAVHGLQRVFLEDWFFATEEAPHGARYFPRPAAPGTSLVQVVHSGPDSAYKAIRETYFAGILNARKRVWIASPYFVPDAGILDAMVLAARSGVDVRYLGLFRPDKWIPFLAARFYWADLLAAGVKVYQYTPGMMHAKYVLVDGEWASVGSANADNRSLLLNFEANCQFFDPAVVAELEGAYLRDLEASVRLDPAVYAARPLVGRLAENAARLFSPIL